VEQSHINPIAPSAAESVWSLVSWSLVLVLIAVSSHLLIRWGAPLAGFNLPRGVSYAMSGCVAALFVLLVLPV